jgi:mycofactocin system glycosyltransferase
MTRRPEPPATAPLPVGFRIVMDTDARQVDEHTWVGGSPVRAVRLTAGGVAALAELRAGPVASRNAGALARRLTDAGLAHPCPPDHAEDVTVVVPVRDRAGPLDRCLSALGGRYPVVVVDDGSRDPAAVADVARGHGATVIPRRVNGGAGPARNTGLDHVDTPVVVFVDSDCEPHGDWIDRLVRHLADPLVAAVAPRVLRVGSSDSNGGSLDLGDRPARVVPNSRVSYVPTAALVVRRAALSDVLVGGRVFDEGIGRGEDVDLVWRLHEAGWRVRYDPATVVRHSEETTWPALLARRFRYGRSAGPLAVRHPTSVRPLVLHPWPTVTVAALLARRPAEAAAAYTRAVTRHRTATRASDAPRAMLTAVHQTWLGIGRYATQYATPVLVAGLLAPGGRRWGRRAAIGSLLLGPPLTEWLARRPDGGPVRFVLRRLADDIAYGAGVWSGCVRAGTVRPIRPVIARDPTDRG